MQFYNIPTSLHSRRRQGWAIRTWPRRVIYPLLFLFIVGAGLFILTQPAYAATITVNGTTCTLADAITAANTNAATGGCPAGSGADTITIVADITLAAELPKITSDLTIQGDAPTRFVSGAQKYRVFWVQSGTVAFKNLTIRNGQATGSNGSNGGATSTSSGAGGGALGAGGGLYVHSGSVTVANVTFRQNVAQGGKGGIVNAAAPGNGKGGNFDNTGGGVAGSPAAAGGFGAGGGGGVPAGRAGVASLLGARGNTFNTQNIASGGNGGAIGGGGGGAGNKGIGGGGGGAGGAIFIHAGALALNNSTFTQNNALGDGTGKGAGAAVYICTKAISPDCNASLAPGSILPTQVVVAASALSAPGGAPGSQLPGRPTGNNTVDPTNVAGQGQAIFPSTLNSSIDTSPVVAGAPQAVGQPSTANSSVLAATLANATVTTADLPPGLTNVVALAGGDEHGLALKGDGTLVAWGDNSVGQGVVPAGLGSVVSIAAGAYHNLALLSDGTLVAWGDNSLGQSLVPAGLSGVVAAIAAGGYHNLALLADGTVVAWGSNDFGQSSVPAGLSDVAAIAAGAGHSLALKRDGTVVAWGNNSYGQLNIPAGLDDVIAIATGQYHSLALRMDGTVVGWGRNDIGQTAAPTDLSNVVMIAANYYHSLALRMDGTVVAWGGNNNGQRDLPANLGGIAMIAAGGQHTLLIQATDSTSPTTELTSSEGYSNTTNAQFWFTGVDDITVAPGLTFQCQLDGGAFGACPSPQNYTGLAAGAHTFAVKAVDAAGNVALTPATYTWTINPPAPVLEVDSVSTTVQGDQQQDGGGQGVVSVATVSAISDFGTATINQATTVRRLTLYNTGNSDLTITGLNLSGAAAGDFTASSASTTLAPYTSALVAVTFAPTAAGVRNATLTITSNTAPYTVDLQGTGTADPYPTLMVPDDRIKVTNNRFTVPMRLATYGASLAAVGFVLNYEATCLTFDTTDSNGDGIPDAVTGLPAAFAPTFSHQSTATGGALEIALLDDTQPIATLSDGPLLTLAFGVVPSCVTTDGTFSLGDVSFAAAPAVSFGDPNAVDVAGAASGAAIPLRFNAAPTALALSNNELSENTPAGATIGALSVTDLDVEDTHSYSLVTGAGDTDNAAFTIQGVTLKTEIALNYEPKPEYRVRVRVTDNGGLTFEQPLIIQTIDLSEAPTGIVTTDGPTSDGNAATVDIDENQPSGTLVAKFDPSNPDSNNNYIYTLVVGSGDSDNASFSIVGNQLRSAVAFNYEAKSTYSLRVRITDKVGRSVEQAFTLVINDLNEGLAATDDVIDPRTRIFLGGQSEVIDVLANDSTSSGTLSVASVTQPPNSSGSVTNNTANVSYTAPQANGSTTFTYQASNGAATSNSATVSVNYVANQARGDCNGNGSVAAADFIATVLEIFDTTNTKSADNEPAWWLTYTGGYAGSPHGCDSNGSGNPLTADTLHRQASVTAADIICSVLIFFGHPCGGGQVTATQAGQTAHLAVADVQASVGAATTLTVTFNSGGNAVAAATFALTLDPATLHFDAITDQDGDGVPDALTLNVPASMNKSATWNAEAQRLEVAVFGMSLPLPTLTDGTLATVQVQVAADAPASTTPLALDLVSLSDPDGNDLPVTQTAGALTIQNGVLRTNVFLPLVTR